MEHQEPLQGVTLVGQLADLVEGLVEKLFPDSVVTSGVVVGGILLPGDHLRGVEEFAVFSGADLVDDGRLQINKDRAGNVLAVSGLVEEGGQSIGRLGSVLEATVFVDFVLKAVQLPASGTELNTSLSNVKRDNLAHCDMCRKMKKKGRGGGGWAGVKTRKRGASKKEIGSLETQFNNVTQRVRAFFQKNNRQLLSRALKWEVLDAFQNLELQTNRFPLNPHFLKIKRSASSDAFVPGNFFRKFRGPKKVLNRNSRFWPVEIYCRLAPLCYFPKQDGSQRVVDFVGCLWSSGLLVSMTFF